MLKNKKLREKISKQQQNFTNNLYKNKNITHGS